MPGTVLENLSGKKLSVLVTILLLSQLACFLVGLISPSPASSQTILATVCVDDNPAAERPDKWFTRQCPHRVELSQPGATRGLDARNLVFVFPIPVRLDFSRWQQNLVGVLQIEMVYNTGEALHKLIELTLDARLAYSNKDEKNGRTPWKHYTHAVTHRYMDCVFEHEHLKDKEGFPYNCTMVPIFELGSLFHDYYLMNLRLPYDPIKNVNTDLGEVDDIYLHIIHMNGGFTRVWVSLKTVFFPIIAGIMVWFWRRVHQLDRTPALLEYLLLSLGGALAFLDLPLEYLTLYFDMPFMLLLGDIRQGIFYAILLSFWLVFTGEHMLVQETSSDRIGIRKYWKHLSSIVIGCVSLLIFDLCERGSHLVNPFHSIWITPLGTNLALAFVICAGLCAGVYFLFLCYMIWKVFKNIRVKRSILPSMTQARRLHYEGVMYRFMFLMGTTLVCAGITVSSFLLNQYTQGEHKWDESMDIELTSVIHTGVFGMWNVYICALLMLYAPSHKRWPTESNCSDGEEVEFSRLSNDTASTTPNEISSLTSFVAKANIE